MAGVGDLKNQTANQEQERQQDGKATHNQCGETRHKTCGKIVNKHGYHAYRSSQKQDAGKNGEKQQWLIMHKERECRFYHFEAVAEGVQLGRAALGTVVIADGYRAHQEIVVQGINRHLGLYFKALGQDREILDKRCAEGPQSRQDVRNIALEHLVDEEAQHQVAEVVKTTLVHFQIGR